MLRLKPFTVPTRPLKLVPRIGLLNLAIVSALSFTVASTWWIAPLWAFVFFMQVTTWWREWRWNCYADTCEKTFAEIAQAAESLGETIKGIAEQIESDQRRAELSAILDPPATVTVDVDVTTNGPSYWVSSSKGQN